MYNGSRVSRIIVGVKYCFRYNQRNRRPQHDENGDPIDMVAMPGPRRRRREKKLMSMDEVNERFPLTKYKAWTTSRAAEGLPTAGGVAAPSLSRAASLRAAEGTIGRKSEETQRPVTPATKESLEQSRPSPESKKEEKKAMTEPTAPVPAAVPQPADATPDTPNNTNKLTPTKTGDTADELDDDDDQIQMAVPTEMLEHPGDSCAICIDTLEDDDDVRGLTCGHAFHASCLDPWLTSRRACCPLCKADYYVPKPRPEGEAAQDGNATGRRTHGHRADAPALPADAYLAQNSRRPRFLPARFVFLGYNQNQRLHPAVGGPQNTQTSAQATNPVAPAQNNQQGIGEIRRFPRLSLPRPNFRAPNFMRRNAAANTTAPTAQAPATDPMATTTPAQLEAGQRPT